MQGMDMWVLFATLQTAHGGRGERPSGLLDGEVLWTEANEKFVCKNELTEHISGDPDFLLVAIVPLDSSCRYLIGVL